MTWQKIPLSSERKSFLDARDYLDTPYVGTLERIYFDRLPIAGQPTVIRLEFTNNKNLSVFFRQNESGNYWGDIREFTTSCERLGIEVQIRKDPAGDEIRLVDKDGVLEHPKLWIRGIGERRISKDGSEIEYVKWGRVERYERTSYHSASQKFFGLTSEQITTIRKCFSTFKTFKEGYEIITKQGIDIEPYELKLYLEEYALKKGDTYKL